MNVGHTMMDEDTLAIAGLHEAGHALAALHFGGRIYGAWIVARVRGTRTHIRGGCRHDGPGIGATGLVIRLAGAGAEVLHEGQPSPASWWRKFYTSAKGDWGEAQPLIVALAEARQTTRDDVIAEAQAQVIAILTHRWDRVQAVARELAAKRYLTGTDITKVIRTVRKTSPRPRPDRRAWPAT